jgi:hypothetical protein
VRQGGEPVRSQRPFIALIDMPTRTAMFVLLCTVATAFVTAQAPAGGSRNAETYESAAIDPDGHLSIVKTGGQRVLVRKEGEQTAFSPPVISPGGTAVAAQAMFANCCTSYDIPLQLVVYADGRVHRFTGVGLPIFQWGFADAATRIAYGQEPIHFGCFIHYELRDIASERLIDEADLPEPCGQIPNPQPVEIPAWIASLTSRK